MGFAAAEAELFFAEHLEMDLDRGAVDPGASA
jgi:hypothetical protein